MRVPLKSKPEEIFDSLLYRCKNYLSLTNVRPLDSERIKLEFGNYKWLFHVNPLNTRVMKKMKGSAVISLRSNHADLKIDMSQTMIIMFLLYSPFIFYLIGLVLSIFRLNVCFIFSIVMPISLAFDSYFIKKTKDNYEAMIRRAIEGVDSEHQKNKTKQSRYRKIYCPNCGKECLDVSFCPNCGKRLRAK